MFFFFLGIFLGITNILCRLLISFNLKKRQESKASIILIIWDGRIIFEKLSIINLISLYLMNVNIIYPFYF